MNGIEFPPSERVNLFGNFTRGELVGAALATTVFGVGVMIGRLLPAVFDHRGDRRVDVHPDPTSPVSPHRAVRGALVAASGADLVRADARASERAVVPARHGGAAGRRAMAAWHRSAWSRAAARTR